MPYILAILVAIILAVVLSTACCRRAPSGTGPTGTTATTIPARPGSRADLANCLAELAKRPPPKNRAVGA